VEARVRIHIIRKKCIAASLCVQAAPHVFQLDDERIAILLDPETRVDNDRTNLEDGVFIDEDAIWQAAEDCPVDAIILYDPETGEQLYP